MPRVLKAPSWSKTRQEHILAYNPLHGDEIRLLHVPSREQSRSDGKLIVSIEHVDLSSPTPPLYTVISWTWGTGRKRASLVVDGNTVSVRKNLQNVLEQVQEEGQTRKVWIDAICINQDDILEKNKQVMMMYKIYSSANYVLACLTAKGHGKIRLKEHAKELYNGLRSNDRILNTEDYPFFFGNEYFSRRWIIQEISQAKEVHFCCEGIQFPRAVLSQAIAQQRLKMRQKNLVNDKEQHAASQAIKLCQAHGPPDTHFKRLEDLLYVHEVARCEEMHDKVYALLSLSPIARQYQTVDYTIKKFSLMMRVLEACSSHGRLSDFRVLSFLIFLRQHLQVDSDKLRDAIFDENDPTTEHRFQIRGVLRGRIEQLECDTSVQEAAIQISGSDQCLFSFREVVAIDQPGTQTPTVGFATASVTPGDEVWQFVRTPVAVIARSDPQVEGYTIIGRALLLKDLSTNTKWPPHLIESKLKWVKAGVERPGQLGHTQNTPTISVKWKGLYELMTWVSLDSL